jgi:hypothetical protein
VNLKCDFEAIRRDGITKNERLKTINHAAQPAR